MLPQPPLPLWLHLSKSGLGLKDGISAACTAGGRREFRERVRDSSEVVNNAAMGLKLADMIGCVIMYLASKQDKLI